MIYKAPTVHVKKEYFEPKMKKQVKYKKTITKPKPASALQVHLKNAYRIVRPS
jgi:hypothetical protein